MNIFLAIGVSLVALSLISLVISLCRAAAEPIPPKRQNNCRMPNIYDDYYY